MEKTQSQKERFRCDVCSLQMAEHKLMTLLSLVTKTRHVRRAKCCWQTPWCSNTAELNRTKLLRTGHIHHLAMHSLLFKISCNIGRCVLNRHQEIFQRTKNGSVWDLRHELDMQNTGWIFLATHCYRDMICSATLETMWHMHQLLYTIIIWKCRYDTIAPFHQYFHGLLTCLFTCLSLHKCIATYP